MLPNNFQLEFRRGRFPLRFSLFSVLILILIWLGTRGTDLLAPINVERMIAQLLLVIVFIVMSLGFLKFFHDVITNLRTVTGMLLGWGIVCLVGISIWLATFLTMGQMGSQWQLPYLRYIDSETTLLLAVTTVIAGLPLFWMEKEIFSVRDLVKQAETTQFSNLGFRIRPHFLFNTLNSVAHLIGTHPARAEKALHNMADVFRVVMADKREMVPLKAEVDLAEKYLYLEKTRLGERLHVASRIDSESLGIMVPVLILQPLLENAVYHGIETRFKGGTINISIQVVGKQLILMITNPLPEGRMKRTSGNKVAQENLRDRIYRTFGSRGTFDSHEVDDTYTVTIRLPI